MTASSPTVAVIDIGSNSIKSLVATRANAEGVAEVATQTLEARISAGISQAEPQLSEAGMARGLEAIQALLAGVAEYRPAHITLVATSAVRDARNGADFRARVRAATGREIRILTGDEEANFIGRGLAADPALGGLRDFYVLDLGGGSLECLAFRNRRIEQATSLQLGCVRLTEKFVADPTQPFPASAREAIDAHVQATLAQSVFAFSLPAAAATVGTGGTVYTMRKILAARQGKTADEISPIVTVEQVATLLESLAPLPLAERSQVAGLPAGRADVFPAALATLLCVAKLGGLTAFQNSAYNLRFGIAAEALERVR
ncbi:MAG TPA: phosphatase [Opitutaceae bacterium]